MWNLQRAVGHTADAGTYTDTPKTNSSIRNIKLPETLLKELKSYRKIQTEERLALDDAWKAGDRVFASSGNFHGNDLCIAGCTAGVNHIIFLFTGSMLSGTLPPRR